MTTWDLSDRETVGRLRQQAVDDALEALEEMWPNNMPEDGNLERFADQKTVEFMQHSHGIPRWVFTAPENSPVRHYYAQVGNTYFWAFLDKLVEAVANRVVASRRLPPRTTPLLASAHHHHHHAASTGGTGGSRSPRSHPMTPRDSQQRQHEEGA